MVFSVHRSAGEHVRSSQRWTSGDSAAAGSLTSWAPSGATDLCSLLAAREVCVFYRAPAFLKTARTVLSTQRASRYSEQCVT